MSEMVERVAKAMARHRWDEFDEEQREAGRELARNAIAEMREPTELMIQAGERLEPDTLMFVSDYWRAMIDEALK